MADLNDVLLSEFRNAGTTINRIAGMTLLFAFLSHVYVVEPYFKYQDDAGRLENKRTVISDRLNTISAEIYRLAPLNENLSTSLRSIEKEVSGFPDELRSKLPELKTAIEEGTFFIPGDYPVEDSGPAYSQSGQMQMQQMDMYQGNYIEESYPEKSSPGEFKPAVTFEEAVSLSINNWFDGLLDRVDEELVWPLKRADMISADLQRDVASEAELARASLSDFIETVDPEFWQYYGGAVSKTSVAQGSQTILMDSFNPLLHKIKVLLEDKERDLTDLQAKLDLNEIELETNSNQLEVVYDSITKIESPLGNLPVKAEELILLIPFMVLISIVVFAFVLTKAGRIFCRIAHDDSRETDEAEVRVLRMAVGNWCFASRWNISGFLLLAGWYALVFGAYVRAGYLIHNHPDVFSLGGRTALFITPSVFPFRYWAGLCVALLFAARSLWSVFQAVRLDH